MKWSEISEAAEASQSLAEAAPDIKWQRFDGGWTGEFQSPSKRWFSIAIARLKNGDWSLEFAETPQHVLYLSGRAEKIDPVDSLNPIGTRAPTGRGEAFAVYRTVMAAMRHFLQTEQPQRVRFKGATPRQTKLYRAMLTHHKAEIAALGYRAKGAGLERVTLREP